ncbi:MAG: hypothetical protein JWQ98_2710 [Chlorobi bacterium]|nr:hypothetical protein [Chlorobiota bacterium]
MTTLRQFVLLTLVTVAATGCASKSNPTATVPTDTTKLQTILPYDGLCGFRMSRARLFTTDTAVASRWASDVRFSSQTASLVAMYLKGNGVDRTEIQVPINGVSADGRHNFQGSLQLWMPGNVAGVYPWKASNQSKLIIITSDGKNSFEYSSLSGNTTIRSIHFGNGVNTPFNYTDTLKAHFSGVIGIGFPADSVTIDGELGGCI